jgi:hypothetical protein
MLENIDKLAIFFGQKISQEFLLPVMMSFLTRSDKSLKLTLLKHVVSVCQVAGSDARVFPCILAGIYGIILLS